MRANGIRISNFIGKRRRRRKSNAQGLEIAKDEGEAVLQDEKKAFGWSVAALWSIQRSQR